MRAAALTILILIGIGLVFIPSPVSAGLGVGGNIGNHGQVEVYAVTRAIGAGSSSCTSQGTITSLTFAHSAGGGIDRFLQVGVFYLGILGASVSGITYSGQSMTSQIAQALPGTSNGRLELWDLDDPPAGAFNVVITFSGSGAEGVVAFALSFNNVAVASGQQSQVATATTSISDTVQQGTPPISAHDYAIAYVGFDGAVASGYPIENSPQESRGLGQNLITGSTCHSMVVSTRESAGDTVAMGYTSAGNGNWAQITSVLHPTDLVPGDGGGGVPVPPAPPQDLKFRCDALTNADWLLPATQPGSRTVTLYDFRSEAVLVVEYLIAWGDGKATVTGRLPTNHTYAREDVYVITMRLILRTGGVQIFVTQVDLRGNNCALQMFAQDFFGPLVALAVLALVFAIVLTWYNFRTRKRGVRRIQKGLLGITVITFTLVLMVAVYAALLGTPI